MELVQMHDNAIVELALEELVKLAQSEEMWVEDVNGNKRLRDKAFFTSRFSASPMAVVTETSKKKMVVGMEMGEVVRILATPREWERVFCGIVRGGSVTADLISRGSITGDSRIWKIQAELVTLSPLIPARKVCFLRYSKKLDDGLTGVVDVSVWNGDATKRLPSGCLVKSLATGGCEVTWVELSEFDDRVIKDEDCRNFILRGHMFSSSRWMAKLNHCKGDTIVLAKKMTEQLFCVISPSPGPEWEIMDSQMQFTKVLFSQHKELLAVVSSFWVVGKPETFFQSFQERRHDWDGEGRRFSVVEEFHSGITLLRPTIPAPDSRRVLQQAYILEDSTAVMASTRINDTDDDAQDIITEGFTILPCGPVSLLTMALVSKVESGPANFGGVFNATDKLGVSIFGQYMKMMKMNEKIQAGVKVDRRQL